MENSKDLISRQAAIDALIRISRFVDKIRLIEQCEKSVGDCEGREGGILDCISEIEDLPSAQPERLMDEDFETIRIHLSAYKEKLGNQHRWKEAEEYQRIIDRFMAFASAQQEIEEWKEELAQNVPNGELISKEAAIDAMTNTLWHYPNECYRNLNEYEFAKGLAELGLKSVTPAQPEQRSFSCGKENDMISRQAAIETARDVCKRNPTMAIRVMNALQKLPVAQPEVLACGSGELYAQTEHKIIRCRECRNYDGETCDILNNLKFSEDDFCSYAERR